jgi:hypothetical protein
LPNEVDRVEAHFLRHREPRAEGLSEFVGRFSFNGFLALAECRVGFLFFARVAAGVLVRRHFGRLLEIRIVIPKRVGDRDRLGSLVYYRPQVGELFLAFFLAD